MTRSLRRVFRFLGPILLAPLAVTTARAQGPDCAKFTPFVDVGALLGRGPSMGEIQAGAGSGIAPPNRWCGFSLEGGYIAPWSKTKSGAGLFSVDDMASWSVRRNRKFLPFAFAGYTRLIGTAHAVNFGGGLDYRLGKRGAIRFEVRDYDSPAAPVRHDVAFRIDWVRDIVD
jgi:hypothetical protein